MTTKIYTVGYGKRQPSEILDLVTGLGAVLVDIRFSPWGRPGFKGFELKRALGDRYMHVKALGNAEYKTGGMRIVEYAAGVAALTALDRPALLLCACASPTGCHRTVVGEMLRQDGFSVTEVTPGAIPAPVDGDLQQLTLWVDR